MVLKANKPRTTNPKWLTDVYATRRFKSVCTVATSAPYTMPMMASTPISGAIRCAASGKSGRQNRRMP